MPYSAQIRAEVLAALATGESAHSVARRLGIPRTTVVRWGAQLRTDGPQKKELGEQVMSFLEEGITTLCAQARFTRDREWLLQQDARSLAMLHGVMFDKAWRLLGAYQPAEDGTDT
jgi:transposase-like protein